MADVKPEQAQQFHEEDEDPAKVFAVLDTAKREGHLRQTEPPKPPPLRQVFSMLAGELRRDLRELRLRERAANVLERVASALRPSRTKVGV